MSTKIKSGKQSAKIATDPDTGLPERQVGHFSTANNTGISVDVEVQLGVDLKDQKLMNDFIKKFEEAREAGKATKEPEPST